MSNGKASLANAAEIEKQDKMYRIWMNYYMFQAIAMQSVTQSMTSLDEYLKPIRIFAGCDSFADILTFLQPHIFKLNSHNQTCVAIQEKLSSMFKSIVEEIAAEHDQYKEPIVDSMKSQKMNELEQARRVKEAEKRKKMEQMQQQKK